MKTYAVREALPPEAEKNLLVYSPLMRQLLFNSGIRDADGAEAFLNPSYDSHTHDPFLMKDMEKAAARILRAISNNERAAIFSDYDADGIPGAVVLHDFFKKVCYANFENYIPDRHGEGFGLNRGAVEEIAKRGAKLLITIDCGITDAEEVARANELGINVIITDHHFPSQQGLPAAYAILNPKQQNCPYPEKNLCGSGVIFKLIQALCLRLRSDIPHFTFPAPSRGWEKWLLDMVGLATLSDMVPLTGENRVFAHFGLKVLRKSPRKGLNELFSTLRVNRQELNEDDVGFSISPRINAASRMGEPMDAFRLFATEDDSEARALAEHLNRINDERKGKVASLVKEARAVVAKRHEGRIPAVVVAGNPNWRPALLGLVANALVEDYCKPVFLWGRDLSVKAAGGSEELKGSCRSDGSADMNLLMQEARSVFSDFGGHAEAGGFSVALEKIHLLEVELERAYEKVRTRCDYEIPQYTAAARLLLDEVSWDLWRDISRMAPFGAGNPKPLFLFEEITVCAVELFGKDKQHVRIKFEKTSGEKVLAIKFFAKPEDFTRQPTAGGRVNLLTHLEKSTFGNYPELRLRIIDIF